MFQILNKLKKLLKKETDIVDKQEQLIEKDILKVSIKDCIEITIKEECTLSEYSKNLDKYEEVKDIFMPIKVLFTNSTSGFSSNTKIVEQKIYIVELDNLKFFITKNRNKVQIAQYKTLNENIYETELEFNKHANTYRIVKSIHDLNYSTGEVKWYPCEGDMVKYFSLDKSEANVLLKDLLENLKKIENIEWKLELETIFITLSEEFNFETESLISDEIMSLNPYPFKVNNEIKSQFDIILNETKEKIGYISFDYSCDVTSKYNIGNVFYGIHDGYRNKGYATKALKLLKKYIQDAQLDFNKDLYFYVNYHNEASKKVILNNGGEIIEQGNPYENEGNGKAHILKIKI